MLLGDHYGLLQIKPESYKDLISNHKSKKQFDKGLESKLINYYIHNHLDYRFICKFFNIYGKYIIEDFNLANTNDLVKQAATYTHVQLQLKQQKYWLLIDQFWNIDNLRPKIITEVGIDIAKWRAEWESDNLKK